MNAQISAQPATPLSTNLRSSFRTAVARLVRLTALGIAAVITALWLQSGGITGVTSLGTALISAGRLTGLFGAYFLLIQVLLMARLPFMEWVAGFDRLTALHRLNGKLTLGLILAHVGFITAGYALTNRLGFAREFIVILTQFPHMFLATAGTLLLIAVVLTSIVIVRRRIRYEAWYLVHLMSYLGIFLAWFHQIPSGTVFLANPVAAAFWTGLYVATFQLVVLFRVGQPVLRLFWHGFRVDRVVEEAPGVYSVYITGRMLNWIDARAGQFFHWRFLDRERWRESHPFSLSAAPNGRYLRLTVKDLGNFSARIGDLKPGTRVMVEGPFGSFTDDARTGERVALIAGGIGITPIRALLEEMSGDITLIYRVANEQELVFGREIERLARQKGIRVHIVTGDHRAPENRHLLSTDHLRSLLPDIARREIYLCGPPRMMRLVKRSLAGAGVASEHIHTDEFAF